MTPITQGDLNKIDKALEVFQGNRQLAAQALGLSAEVVKNAIRNPALKAKWTNAGMDKVDAATREKVKININEGDLELLPAGVSAGDMVSSRKHDEVNLQIQKLGWEGLGITGKTAELMSKFESFTGGKVLRTIDATHGGMMFGFAKTAERYEYVSEKLSTKEVKDKPELEAEYHHQFMQLAEQMRKFNAEATKAAHIRAMIDEKARAIESKGRKKRAKWTRAGSIKIK